MAFLSKAEVAARLSTGDRKVQPGTVEKWVTRGLRVRGRRVRLVSTRLPSGMAFREDDVERFLADLNGGRGVDLSPLPAGARPVERCTDEEIGTHPPVPA
jgi:hypothetical protein